MSDTNRSFRIRAKINSDEQFVNVDFTQNYDKFEILSLTLNQSNSYRLMNSNTGIIAGRVLANEGFGIPNAKLSVFIKYDGNDELQRNLQYHYTSTLSTDNNGIRYNLLDDSTNDVCRQVVGSFPSKRFVLDNDDVIEVFDQYYTYTTRTNNSGDYMIYGVPTGPQTVHCDIDLSDIGILSQTPRDMIYKGYNLNLFDSPSKFKSSTNLSSLAQIISQDSTVFVYPFWGDTTNNPTGAAVTRCDINISYKFEPTCVFLGSVITDTGDNAISKKCIPSKAGGKMAEMTTGTGMIEMIRKTSSGDIEQIAINGNEVINESGTWCYQIPMNLDYVMTDEYGNTVLSDNPNKGIPTRTRVRFRVSLHETPADGIARKRARYLIPNNPNTSSNYPEFNLNNEVDYEFGSKTSDENFRDLMWNNVYTIKNYIPRIQKARLPNNLKHLGIKMVNHSGNNNPMPFNKLSIKFNFVYTFLCVLVKVLVQLVRFTNIVINAFQWLLLTLAHSMVVISNRKFWPKKLTFLAGIRDKTPDNAPSLLVNNINWTFPNDLTFAGFNGTQTITLNSLDDENDNSTKVNKAAWFAVAYYLYICCKKSQTVRNGKWDLSGVIQAGKIQGLAAICCALVVAIGRGIALEGLCDDEDGNTITVVPGPNPERSNFLKFISGAPSDINCFANNSSVSDLYNCVENQLAQDNEVTSFNFFNDWINGVLYMPLWYRKIKPKRKFLFIKLKAKDQWCNGNETAINMRRRKLKLYSNDVVQRKINGVEDLQPLNDDYPTVNVRDSIANDETGVEQISFNKYNEDNCYGYKCHKYARSETPIYTGFIIEKETLLHEHVYYYKPVTTSPEEKEMVTMFATDIVLLGSLNACDLHGIPQFFKILEGTSYQMPPDLLSEDYDYITTNESNQVDLVDENDANLIDNSTRRTEYTGADWGNLGVDQSNYQRGKYEANENIYDNGGLFYGLTCFDSYTKPKSIINLERLCEIGVSLDESHEILKSKVSLTDTNAVNDEDALYTTLTPDGYISYDEIYNPDYRSMFATLNGNGLRTKINLDSGLLEYDLTHVYVDNFDGSLSKIMGGKATQGNVIVNGVNTNTRANYSNNYKLETSDTNYIRFRFGDYVKKNGKKLLFYEHNKQVTFTNGVPVMSGYKIPRYENSFYFYFGLKRGNTAIDRFYHEYYADCGNEENYGKAINITYKGNDWCNQDGGYIAFQCNMNTPISVTLIDKDDNDKQYHIDNINSNTFYIGASTDNIEDIYSHAGVNHVDHGNYSIEIIDGDGNMYTDEIIFRNDDKLTYDIEKYDFNLSNDDLCSRYGINDSFYCVNVISTDSTHHPNVIATPHEYIIIGSGYDATTRMNYAQYAKVSINPVNGKKTVESIRDGYSYDITTDIVKDASGNIIAHYQYPQIEYVDNETNNAVAIKETVVYSDRLGQQIVYMVGYNGLERTNILTCDFYNTVAEDNHSWLNQDEYDAADVDDYFELTYWRGNTSEIVYMLNNEIDIARSMYGYICISNISVDNFKITVVPSSSELSGYIGYECVVNSGKIDISGYGHLGIDKINGRYYVGLPYGNVMYKITVTMLCNNDDTLYETTNQITQYATVSEGICKMYINGIDYDLIKYFQTGWYETSMVSMPQTTFNHENIKGWNDITNIGIENWNTIYPITPDITYTIVEAMNVSEYNTANGVILTEDEFNSLSNKKYVSNITINNLSQINGIGNAMKANPVYNEYYKTSAYNWIDGYTIDNLIWEELSNEISLIEDVDGKKPIDDGYVLTYNGDIEMKCNMINEIMANRIEITKQIMGNFRPNANGVTEIVITGKTKSLPIKYLIVNN